MAGFGDGAGLKNPVTEPKQSQKSKRPLFIEPPANRYSFYGNALDTLVTSHLPCSNGFPGFSPFVWL